MKERECDSNTECDYDAKCDYKIIALVDGERKEINCDPSRECLRKIVWKGMGVIATAIQILEIPRTKNVEAFVEGGCTLKES